MIKHGLLTGASNTRFVSEQGTKMGRRSLLHVRIAINKQAEGIYVGGHNPNCGRKDETLAHKGQ